MSMLQQLVEDAKTMEAEAVRAENSQEPQWDGERCWALKVDRCEGRNYDKGPQQNWDALCIY